MSENQGPPSRRDSPPTPREGRTAADIEAWLISHIAELAGVEPVNVDPSRPFTYFGLSSAEAVILAGEMEDWLGRPLPATLAWDYPTVENLARHLAGEAGALPTHDGPGASPSPTGGRMDQLLSEVEHLSEDEAQAAPNLDHG